MELNVSVQNYLLKVGFLIFLVQFSSAACPSSVCGEDGQILPDIFSDVFRVCKWTNEQYFEEKRRCRQELPSDIHSVCTSKIEWDSHCPWKIRTRRPSSKVPMSVSSIRSTVCTKFPKITGLCNNADSYSITGACNNLNNPLWGAAFMPLRRLLPQNYENQVDAPRGWFNDLPSPRLISSNFFGSTKRDLPNVNSALFMSFGQLLFHDTAHTPPNVLQDFKDVENCLKRCKKDVPCPCFPISVPVNDSRNVSTLPFIRSKVMCLSSKAKRNYEKISIEPYKHPNVITAWLDQSIVYGSSEEELRMLRNDNGTLKTSPGLDGEGLLPLGKTCQRREDLQGPVKKNLCFIAGDKRVAENVGLSVLHVIFHRHHNYIYNNLKKNNPNWSDNKLFEQARKINIAMYQKIIVDEFLPRLFGKPTNEILGKYTGYDPTVDGQMSIEFTTAATRYGHAQISGFNHRNGENYRDFPLGHLPMFEGFHASRKIVEEGGIDPYIRGMLCNPSRPSKDAFDIGFDDMVRENLFAFNQNIPADLIALNIQRGRDHGLQPFMEYRRFFKMTVLNTWEELQADPDFENITDERLNRLKKVLKNVLNIDLFVGGFLEKPRHGILGPTFLAIVKEQFQRSRKGDRFWFERKGRFTPIELAEIKKSSLSMILCQNSDGIKKVPKNPFKFIKIKEFKACENFKPLNFNVFGK